MAVWPNRPLNSAVPRRGDAKPVLGLLRHAHHHALCFGVLVEGLHAVLAADAALFEAAPRATGVVAVMSVHPKHACAGLTGHTVSLGDVHGPTRPAEAILGVVGQFHGVRLVPE